MLHLVSFNQFVVGTSPTKGLTHDNIPIRIQSESGQSKPFASLGGDNVGIPGIVGSVPLLQFLFVEAIFDFIPDMEGGVNLGNHLFVVVTAFPYINGLRLDGPVKRVVVPFDNFGEDRRPVP